MSAKDTITYQKKLMGKQQSKANIQKLIALERAQKLDLLIHLINNLSLSLIVCGPEGIGKTTILDALFENKKDSWPICLINGKANLSFETIQDKFSQQLTKLLPEYAGQDLSAILDTCNQQNNKIVLIIDDAGLLVPGLISTLIEFADANGSLRLVLSLTHDELHVKSSSDRFINECHLIEIPPITKKQCAVFLQNLSAQPGAVVPFSAVTEGLVDNLYRQTHGIPGKIVKELPGLAHFKPATGLKWGVISLAILAIVGILSLLFFDEPDSNKIQPKLAEVPTTKQWPVVDKVSPPIQEQKDEKIDSDVDFYNNRGTNKKDVVANEVKNEVLPTEEKIVVFPEKNASTIKQEVLENIEPDEDAVKIVTEKKKEETTILKKQPEEKQKKEGQQDTKTVNQLLEKVEKKQEAGLIEKQVTKEKSTMAGSLEIPKKVPVDVQQVKKEQEKKLEAVPVENKVEKEKSKVPASVPVPIVEQVIVDDRAWVSAQKADHHTLQLMVLSKRKSAEDLLIKNQKQNLAFKYFQLKKQEQSKYVVIYGSFKTLADAEKAKKALPAEFRKAWIRKFKVLQKQIKEN